MAFLLTELFWTGILPGLTAAAVMLLCQQLRLRAPIAWSVSFAIGFIVGQTGLTARDAPSAALPLLWDPLAPRDWLPWLMLLAVGITILAAYAPRHWQRWVVLFACVFASAIPIRLLAGNVARHWETLEKVAVIAVWTAALVGLWATLALGRVHAQPRFRGGLLFAVAVGIAIAVTLAQSFVIGRLAGVAAAALAGALLGDYVFARFGRASSRSPDAGFHGAAGPIALALGGILLLGHYYANLGALPTVLLTLAIAAAGGRLPDWPAAPAGRMLLRVGLTIVLIALAIALAWAARPENPYAG